MTTVLIVGNTYPVKESLKALGGRWNAKAKGWDVPAAKAPEARMLVETASRAAKPRNYRALNAWSRRTGSYVTRFSSGAEIVTNYAGRCEDAPCCGCCS